MEWGGLGKQAGRHVYTERETDRGDTEDKGRLERERQREHKVKDVQFCTSYISLKTPHILKLILSSAVVTDRKQTANLLHKK